MIIKQRTIKNTVSVSGRGLHSGEDVTLTFKPSSIDSGYLFKRIDIEGEPILEADIDYVTATTRGTTIEKDGVRVQTVEHVLAALSGLSIDNVIIELNKPESPIMDGSANDFVNALIKAEIIEQDAERKYYELTENIKFYDEENDVEMTAIPSDDFRVSAMIDYGESILGTQSATFNICDFVEEISKCRTFVFLHELELLIKNDLVKGGDINNAIVFVNRQISQEELDYLAAYFKRPQMKVLREGILNNLELRYRNEPARHKILDIIGDISLIGKPVKAHIIASKPGHSTNVKFFKKLKKHVMKAEEKKPWAIDLSAKPVYDINDIKKILPHRPPFLLVDKIMEIGDDYVIGMKNVSMNEPYFVGHFPEEPIMPGVLQIEAMAQVGGILAMRSKSDPENYVTYFLKVENARFKSKVVPGDTLVFHLAMITPERRGLFHMEGKGYVGDKLAIEAVLLAQIAPKIN